MVTETTIALAEMDHIIQLKKNSMYFNEREKRAMEEAKRLLINKDSQIKEMTELLTIIYNAANSGGIVSNEVFNQIKSIINK